MASEYQFKEPEPVNWITRLNEARENCSDPACGHQTNILWIECDIRRQLASLEDKTNGTS